MINFVADVHVGNHKKCGGPMAGHINTRCREVITSLGAASDSAVGPLVILGDLFDKHNPHPAVIKAAGDALAESREPHKQAFVLAGNHDIASSHDGDSAIAVLEWLPNVFCITEPTVLAGYEGFEGATIVAVPFEPGNMVENVTAALDRLDYPKGSILAAHFGISDEKTPKWLLNTEGSVSVNTVRLWIDKYSLGGVFVGDWHSRSVWEGSNEEPIVQIGALVPTGWDNEGQDYGYVSTYHPPSGPRSVGSVTTYQVPGPRFVNASTEEDVIKALSKYAKDLDNVGPCPLRVKVKSKLFSPDFVDTLKNDDRVLAVIEDIGVDVSRTSAENAVAAVRKGSQSIEALTSAYVEGLPNVGADMKKQVLTTALEYLKLGGS